ASMITRRNFVGSLGALPIAALLTSREGIGQIISALSKYVTISEGVTRFVKIAIGTGGHGHTYTGATVPFGMVQLSPDTYNKGWDWCSGYTTQTSPSWVSATPIS